MVKKTTIGKIQIVIGIILLIAGIIGIFYALYFLDNNLFRNPTFFPMINETSTDRQIMIYESQINMYVTSFSMQAVLLSNLGLVLILTIILSLLFITQGLANLSEEK